MEIGIDTKTMDYKNLCCLSITCRRLRRLATDDNLWSSLLLSDYPSSGDDLDVHTHYIDFNIRNNVYASSSTANGKFKNRYKIRQASVALNIWQPEIIGGRQRQMVQQSNVPVGIRTNTLEMELNLCKQQIAGFDIALRAEIRRFDAAKEELASVKYHPLQGLSRTRFQLTENRIRNKKLKNNSPAKCKEDESNFY